MFVIDIFRIYLPPLLPLMFFTIHEIPVYQYILIVKEVRYRVRYLGWWITNDIANTSPSFLILNISLLNYNITKWEIRTHGCN